MSIWIHLVLFNVCFCKNNIYTGLNKFSRALILTNLSQCFLLIVTEFNESREGCCEKRNQSHSPECIENRYNPAK